LGKETVLQLARHNPKRIYVAARTEYKARDAITSIQKEIPSPADIRYIPLDLSSFTSIRRAAEQFSAENERLDILILNAGIMGQPAVTTQDGYEIQFGTNHVGHFLLTKLLLPILSKTSAHPGADVRVVTLASLASGTVPVGRDYMELVSSTPNLLALSTWQRYALSKSANILFAAELARRHPEIMSVSVHPGVVGSNLYDTTQATHAAAKYVFPLAKKLFLRDVPSGSLNQLWAAAGAKLTDLVPGGYYPAVGGVSRGNQYATDQDLAKKLWDWTDKEVEKAL
jgi:NAD(P)-dependent dehydrogenase (short-subunit alcohol dehydrogenase family)